MNIKSKKKVQIHHTRQHIHHKKEKKKKYDEKIIQSNDFFSRSG